MGTFPMRTDMDRRQTGGSSRVTANFFLLPFGCDGSSSPLRLRSRCVVFTRQAQAQARAPQQPATTTKMSQWEIRHEIVPKSRVRGS